MLLQVVTGSFYDLIILPQGSDFSHYIKLDAESILIKAVITAKGDKYRSWANDCTNRNTFSLLVFFYINFVIGIERLTVFPCVRFIDDYDFF